MPLSIGPYRVVRELGRGGMGLVYEAVHRQLGKRVAIKTLRSHLLEDQAHVQRFSREGRAACRIGHPHVVEVFELGSHAGAPYLVMDLLAGVHLGARLESDGPIPLTPLVDLMLPILAGVSAAHAAGVVHRDLKPSNIMLARGRDGALVPKVLDFGTSKLREQGPEELLTLTGAVLGTLHYMSPEQTRAPKDADARSDQYSLGLILYECATGKKPFRADSAYEIMQAIMTTPVPPPSALRAELPEAFDAVVLRAMSRAPRERYASVAALGLALLPFASDGARNAWERELSSAVLEGSASSAPSSPLPPAAASDVSQTLSAANELGARRPPAASSELACAERDHRKAVAALLIPALLAALWLLVAHDNDAGCAALIHAHQHDQALATPSPATKRVLPIARSSPGASPPAAPSPAPADVGALLARGSARVDPQPRPAFKGTAARSKRSSRAARVQLGDNDAPILE